MLPQIAVIFLAFAGFWLSTYIHHKKQQKAEIFVCPLRGSCSEVIHSDYSRFFGIPVEKIGLVYYAALAVGYGVFLGVPELDGSLALALVAATAMAFMFSVYLTFIQVIVIRKLCTWCLLSATFCLAIFFLSLSGSFATVEPFLLDYRPAITIAHVVAMALGLGSATITDVFFFKFLKDRRISQKESRVLSALSECVWLALGIALATGLAMYLPDVNAYNTDPRFIAKAAIVGILIVNGAFLNRLIIPKLVNISFGRPHDHAQGELVRIRKLAFALGPISVVSWYSAFILEILPASTLPLGGFALVYAVAIFIAVAIGQAVDCRLETSEKVGSRRL